MTRRNPERPPGPAYYRLPEASWTMIRDEYLSGWTAKEIAQKWRVSQTSVYRHASDGGWTKAERGRAFHDQIIAEAQAGGEGEDGGEDRRGPPRVTSVPWSWKAPPEGLRQGPRPLPGMGHYPKRVWSPPEGYGPMPPHLVPPVPRPPEPGPAPEQGPEPELDGAARDGAARDGAARDRAGWTPDADAASPATALSVEEAADQAVAAAANAVAAGRFADAERLGRLGATLRKLASQGPARGGNARGGERGAPSFVDDDDEALGEIGDRPLNCTAKTCTMRRVTEVIEGRVAALVGDLREPDGQDVEDWTAMAAAIGAKADADVMYLGEVYRAEGLGSIRKEIVALCGPAVPGDRSPGFNPYRTP